MGAEAHRIVDAYTDFLCFLLQSACTSLLQQFQQSALLLLCHHYHGNSNQSEHTRLKTHQLESTASTFVQHGSEHCWTVAVLVGHQSAPLCRRPALAYLCPRTQSLHPQNQSQTPAPVSRPSPPVESLGDGIRPAWLKEPLSAGPLTCISSPMVPHQKGTRRRGGRILKKRGSPK